VGRREGGAISVGWLSVTHFDSFPPSLHRCDLVGWVVYVSDTHHTSLPLSLPASISVSLQASPPTSSMLC